MEEDDFGDLYGDQAPVVSSIGAGSLRKTSPGYAFYDDDDDEGFGVIPAVHSHPPHGPSNPHGSFKLPEAQVHPYQPAERDSDEDDDMLLLGYNCKSSLGSSKTQVPMVVTNKVQAAELDNLQEGFSGLAERARVQNITENGAISPSACASRDVTAYVLGDMTKEDTRLGAHNPLDDPNGSPDVGDLTNHTLTIPGLSTTMNAPLFDLGDNGDVADNVWEQRQGGKTHLGTDRDVAAEGAEDWDTDSEDDLQIVLNTEYPYYQTGDKVRVSTYEGGSEDEDDEDLIIVAGGNPLDEGEEQSFQPIDVLATPGDGSIHPTGDKQAGVGDEKGQQDKVVSGVAALSQPVSRVGYGYHNYNSPYKYVRPGAAPLYGTGVGPAAGQALGNRVSFLKGVNGRGDLRGFVRGSFGPQAASQLPLWATQSGYEYTLPPSMTVFDIDLEAFDEKPWRQPAIDVTDFFNFGFEETTWKYYCKQLAQLRIESTMQSKIRVYESGRSEQEYDPDLPPELAVAAGLHEVCDRNQHRLVESEATASAMGRRGHTPMIPLGRPIQVEGGLGDRRPSSDLRKQRIRDSDRIILIDAMEEEESEAQRLQDENIGGTADETDKEEELEEEEEEEEEEEQEVVDVRNTFKGRPQQHMWHEERVFDSKNHMPKGANTLPMESSQKFSEQRFRTGFDPASVSTVGNMQEHPLASKSVVATELGKFSGESFSATHRETSSRPRTVSKLLERERRDWDQIHSQSGGLCQDAESNPKSLNDDGESHAKKHTGKEQQIQSQEGSHVGDDMSPGKFQTDHSTGQGENGLVTTTSRGVLIQGNIAEEVQGESPGCSSKRQRLVSPEGSHTASWDNYDPQKSSRSVASKKESRDSGDSARDGQEDGSQYRKKHKSYFDMSRGQHKDSREGSESYHKKQASILSRHELEKEIHPHVDNSQETGRRSKPGNMERDTVKDLSSHLKDREENAYAQGKKREEEAGRREYLAKEAVHCKEKAGNRPELRKKDEEEREAAYHRDRGGNRPESRKREEEDRRGRQDSRKRDEEDRRDRLDIGYQHREKEVESLNWRSSERRKREEEYRRRDWSKEGGGHDKKEKEKHISERPDRDLDQLSRRKEEESWKRERLENHRRSKARDGSSRVKEDSRHRNGEYQDPHGRAHKDDERTAQAERSSRRHDEDRSWRGRDESHVSESTRSSEPRNFSKDRREDLDDYGNNKIRSQEGRARSISDREGLHLLEGRDRDSGKHNRLSDDPRTSERRWHSDKHRSDAKRRKESDKETNESASQLGDYSDASRKRKAASDKMETAIRKQVEDPVISRTKGSQDFVTRIHPEETKEEFNESNSGKLDNKAKNSPATEKWSSEDDEQQKGRTKLERWTSHKDLEFHAFEKLPFHGKAKKDERHRQSSVSQEKQRHDPSKPHDDLNQENQLLAGIDSTARKASVFEEQVNGKVLEPDQKGGSVVQSKESHAYTEDKNYIEIPEHHQHDPALRRTDMAAKLEKRKERFKVPVEDKELLRNLDSEDHQMIDKELSRQKRPPRKRRWASG